MIHAMSNRTEISKAIPAMRSVPNAGLDQDAVELANAHGPYSHGTWTKEELSVGNEEALAGRGALLVSRIRTAILKRFTVEKIRGMTLVDVGCYDGWLLCQLEDLPFAKIIGIEPREKNLIKGRAIRQLLGINTRCEFRQGMIENLQEVLNGSKADVVVCAGVFHHLTSTADGVSALRAICRQLLFVETICLPEILVNDQVRRALEPKDIPYFFGSQAIGVTGHKLESGYYDGSATSLSVVSLPSISALKMYLEVGGFENIKIDVDPEMYAKAVTGGDRSYSAICLTATPSEMDIDPSSLVNQYETGMVCTLLPEDVIRPLYATYCLGEKVVSSNDLAKLVVNLIQGSEIDKTVRDLRTNISDIYSFEILKNLRYAPNDKILLEFGKLLIAQGCYEKGEGVLYTITRRLNADWRSVYRAFCVISWSCAARGEDLIAQRYRTLCRTANPQFPENLLIGGTSLFRL